MKINRWFIIKAEDGKEYLRGVSFKTCDALRTTLDEVIVESFSDRLIARIYILSSVNSTSMCYSSQEILLSRTNQQDC